MLLAAGTTNASTKVSLLGAWLTDDGCIEGLLHEVIADLHAYESLCVGTKPAAQAAEAVKKQVQKRKLYWLNANTVKRCADCAHSQLVITAAQAANHTVPCM